MSIAKAGDAAAWSPALDRGSLMQSASEIAALGVTIVVTTAAGVAIWYGSSFAISILERACGFITRLWRARRPGQD